MSGLHKVIAVTYQGCLDVCPQIQKWHISPLDVPGCTPGPVDLAPRQQLIYETDNSALFLTSGFVKSGLPTIRWVRLRRTVAQRDNAGIPTVYASSQSLTVLLRGLHFCVSFFTIHLIRLGIPQNTIKGTIVLVPNTMKNV